MIVWRDSNGHTFTVTSMTPTADGEITLSGTISNCTPEICLWSHENEPYDIDTTPDEVDEGRTFAWTRQDIWENDPHPSPQPQATKGQRQWKPEAQARQSSPPPVGVDAFVRETQMLIDAGLIPPRLT